MAIIFGTLESSAQVSGRILTPVLDFTLYTIIGTETEFAIASKCLIRPSLSTFVIIWSN